jgi:transcriptional regulator with GAF, ATPase, and Fis domain
MAERQETRGAAREAAIVDAFIHLSDTLVAGYDVIDFLHFLTDQCVTLADVSEAGVVLAAPSGNLQAVAASSERGHLLELFELQNQDGPCLDAYRTGLVVESADLAQDRERWPTFAQRALDVGFSAVHSVPLRLRDRVIGALNLLRTGIGALSEADAKLVRALADIATVGVLQERTIAESQSTTAALQTALTSRILIEQAKGILAERAVVSIDAAFELLRGYARGHRLGITDVAGQVVRGSLDIPG